MRRNLIIFTDLDGTLLDSAYSFRKALPALKIVKEKNIPLILCSSKTGAEIEQCRKKLGNKDPFISENGGGIFVPKKYSKFRIQNSGFKIQEEENYFIIKLGAAYVDLRKAVEELRSEGFDIRGFGDMTVKEVAGLTGLKMSDAKRAKQRDFDEPFIFGGKERSLKRLKQRIRSKGYNYTQGEFFHITGDSDKGRAVEILKKLYSEQYGKITTVALGDSPNDIEMLRNVDYPVIIKKHDGSYDRRVRVKNAVKAPGIGPEGWNRAVLELLETLLV
ncbi:MAG TPA: HAD-IIB family hydrolase [Nitrospirae bacterium]|nr:glucosyl-3-phosphoglycerate/mannosyl-3-phosphoglycerate phosphatase [bacterium BMS3Abin06]HDH10703.1 HAD-IIB family hydrolase [Nitrospirota bacterium]HDZ02991.1 HAD-IIB family hydrolase [Nitrospirota bacterium]